MLMPLLSTWYRCVQQLGDMELSVQLLLEMLAHGKSEFYMFRIISDLKIVHWSGTSAADDEPDAIQEDLLAVLKVCPSKSLI